MEGLKEKVKETVDFIRKKTTLAPDVGIILGTGLGQLAQSIEIESTITYDQMPHFPISTVESHAGRLIFGALSGKKVVAMQGRFHFYEGYTMQEITFPVRIMKELGIQMLLVSNACGGLNPQFKAGDIMTITDHINLQGGNPLIGVNDDTLGPRFPDMYNCYDKDLIALAEETALELGIKLHKGVYVSVTGPNLETAAEYRFLRGIGADVVGMSTVPEVIAARHQGTKVLGFSIVTDMGLPDALKPTNLDEIIAVANRSEPILTKLLTEIMKRIKL